MSVRKAIAAPRFAPTPLSWSMHMAFAVLAAAAMVGPARANPVGGVVVGGQASIAQPSPALTQINQSSQRAVIDWRSFSIGVGEAVRFNQPSASAATLNRVVGNDPSSILGSLSANGRVYLVNQNGVFIGRDAQVDAAALVLATANVSNSDFMAGRLNFNQPGKPGARIINEGRITAADGGLVAMVAPGVENRGVISAKLGQVILSGAPAFSLDLFGDGLVNIVLNQAGMGQVADATGKPLTNYVDSSGRVTAEGGRIWISAATARGLVDGMVNISGELRATRVAQRGGEITLLGGNALNISGSVVATSADGKGGSIAASADKIVLASNARLDASGATGGGSVLVGGGFQGKSPVPGAGATAGSLAAAQGATVRADATASTGDGGLVVLWSEQDTRVGASVSARAGAVGGNGGTMEVSGKKYLAFDGRADASAPNGLAGTLLLDPGSLTVADVGTVGFTASGADSTVAASTINQTLRSGTSVALQADDNITVNSQIDGRAPVGGVASPGGGLSLAAGGAVNVNSPIVLNDGAFSSNSASFTQADGNVVATLGGKPISVTTSGSIATQFLLTRGDVNLSSAVGNITAGQQLGDTAQPIGILTVAAPSGNATITKGIFTSGDAVFGARNVQVGQARVDGELRVAAGSNLQLQGDAQVGGLRAGAPGAPIGSFSMVNPSGGTAPQLDAGLHGISVTANSIGKMGGLRSKADIELKAGAGDVTLGRLETTGAGSIVVGAAGNIALPSNVAILTHAGNIALSSTAGGINSDADGTVIAANDPENLAGTQGKIQISAEGDINLRQLVATGRVDITSKLGSINLREALGGKNLTQPAIGELHISAWKDVTTNGLNLAGSTPGLEGLSIEAGANNSAGGHIYVNDRIGVSSGDLRFGSVSAQTDKKFSATLYQGVFARNGDQKITFNVPLVADGEKIFETWQRQLTVSKIDGGVNPTVDTAIGPPVSGLLVDMLLIPVNLENTEAERLVSIARRGMYVIFNEDTRLIEAICPQSGCQSETNAYLMIPKIVISAQDKDSKFGSGRIELNGGIALAEIGVSAGGAKTSALEIIVPLSEREKTPISTFASQRNIHRDVSFQTRFSPTDPRPRPEPPGTYDYLFREVGEEKIPAIERLTLSQETYSPQVVVDKASIMFNGVVRSFMNASVEIHDPAADNGLAPGLNDLVSISLFIYPGAIAGPGGAFQGDTSRIIPSEIPNFRSPLAGFQNASTGDGRGASLSGQILAMLPPTSTVTGGVGAGPSPGSGSGGEATAGSGTGEVVAAVAAIESRASQHQESQCSGRDRQVVGRSAGDEADVGTTTALRGAPQSVFRTTYALGEVSEQLTTADGSSIAGARRAAPCP